MYVYLREFAGTEIFLGVHLDIFQRCIHLYYWATLQYINIIRDAFMYKSEGCIKIFLRAAFKHRNILRDAFTFLFQGYIHV
jgi:hypothetical protein